jgi:hypothetical protein
MAPRTARPRGRSARHRPSCASGRGLLGQHPVQPDDPLRFVPLFPPAFWSDPPSAPSRIRTCGLFLRREALYRRGNLVPTRKSLQIGVSRRDTRSRDNPRATGRCSHFVPTSQASGATAPYSARAGTSPPTQSQRPTRYASDGLLPNRPGSRGGRPRTPPCPRMRARHGVRHSRDGLLLLVGCERLGVEHRPARNHARERGPRSRGSSSFYYVM